jgi:DNA-binding PadR family transcriptional regulator
MSHKYLILGLLADRPMTGYDMRKHVKTVLHTVTTASYGTLYPTLHKLLDEGLVKVVNVEQANRPAKKVYHLTKAGDALLQAWLKTPAEEDKVKREFLLKLYFAKDSSHQDLRRLLAKRRADTQAKMDSLIAVHDTISNPRRQWIVAYALSMCRAELEWLKQMEQQIAIV